MKSGSIGLPKILRFVFLSLTIAGSVLLLLNLSAYLGISGNGPFIRGWVSTVQENKQEVFPNPDGSGDYKMYNFGAQKLVVLEFKDMGSLLQARYLMYILMQNLVWVLGLFILYQMYRVFKNLDLSLPFQTENTRRIRFIALAVLAFPFVRNAANQLMAGITYEAQGHRITTAVPSLLTETLVMSILLALVIFSLAEVFRNGTQLQQEQDLTI